MTSSTIDRRIGLTDDKAYKVPVATVTNANITLAGEQTVNGYAVKAINSAGYPDRVLVIAQTDPTQNGIWDVNTGPWTRSLDANNTQNFTHGTQVFVGGGGGVMQIYYCTSANPIIPDVTPINFALVFIPGPNGIIASQYISPGYTAAQNNAGWVAMMAAAAAMFPSPAIGCNIYIPGGTYLFSAELALIAGITIIGSGKVTTVFSFSHLGNGMTMTSPINASTGVFTRVEGINFISTNSSNTGGGYIDLGGTFVTVYNCRFKGWQYNIIFDQTEIATIELCDSEQTGPIVAGVWLVNGADRIPGAQERYTNRITIKECQFNGAGYHILDDGGYNHHFSGNNHNAGTTAIRIADLNIGLIDGGCEFEQSTAGNIVLAATTLSGTVVRPCNITVLGNTFSTNMGGTYAHINVVSDGNAHFVKSIGNTYYNTPTVITGVSNIVNFWGIGDKLISVTNYLDAYFGSSGTFSDFNYGSFTPVLSFGGASTGITYSTQQGRYMIWGNQITFSINIVLTSKGSATGNALIAGFPVTNGAGIIQALGIPQITGLVTATSAAAYIASNGSGILMNDGPVNTANILTNANFSNSSTITLSGSYFIK